MKKRTIKNIIFLAPLSVLAFVLYNILQDTQSYPSFLLTTKTAKAEVDKKVSPASFSLSVDDIATQENIHSVQVSPDGKYTLIEKSLPYLKVTEAPSIEVSLMNNATKTLVWKTQKDWVCSSPQWSPDGKYVSFLKRDKQNNASLFITTLDQYNPTEVTQNIPGVIGYVWAPNEKKIALLFTEKSRSEDNVSYIAESEKTEYNLAIINLALPLKDDSKIEVVPLTGFKLLYSNIQQILSWSPDSINIVFAGIDQEENTEGLFNLNVETNELGLILKGNGASFPLYSPNGESIIYIANATDTPTSDKSPPIKEKQIFLKKVNQEEPQKLSSTFDGNPLVIWWFSDNQHILVQERYKTLTNLYKIPMNGNSPTTLNQGNGNFISYVSLNASGKHLGLVLQSPQTSPAAFVSSTESFIPQRVDQESLQTLPVKSEIIQWQSFDGKEIEGILIYPSLYKAGKRYPLIVAAHGGPYDNWAQAFTGTFYNNIPFSSALLASKGYAVLLPNVRGSSGYGIEFGNANYKDLGGGDFKDLMAGVDSVIKKGIADPERLAIWGWGYGGYLAAWATTQTNRFKAAIIGAGIIDLISFSATTNKGGFLESYLGGYFWDNKELWLSRSPIMNVKNLTTPTLLQYGLQDTDFIPAQGLELLYALRVKDIPASMLMFTGEGHHFDLFVPARKLGLTSTVEWLEKYLGQRNSESDVSAQ